MTSDILFERRGAAGVVTLNRQQALNAVTHEMVRSLRAALEDWAQNDAITRVVIAAAPGRAFSAGGDIRALTDLGKAGKHDEAVAFWRDEYPLNAYIKNYRKPYIALIDGIVMGGGVGISVHGSHRVAQTQSVRSLLANLDVGQQAEQRSAPVSAAPRMRVIQTLVASARQSVRH